MEKDSEGREGMIPEQHRISCLNAQGLLVWQGEQ